MERNYVYALRLDSSHDEDTIQKVNKVIKWLRSAKYIISHEVSSKVRKPHYQGIVYSTRELTTRAHKKNKSQFFNRLGFRGNDYSLSPVKSIEDYSQYIGKDNNVITYKGFTDKEVQTYIAKGVKRKKEVEEYKKLTRKGTKIALYVKVVREECKDLNQLNLERVISIVYDYCIYNKTLLPSAYHMEQYAYTILGILTRETKNFKNNKKEYIDRIMASINKHT